MRYGIIFTALFTLMALPVLAESSGLSVKDAYAYPPLGAGKVGVAYLKLINDAPEPYRVTGARCDEYGSVELHTHAMDDGIMRMRKLEEIEVPAKQTVELKSGGLHLMLMGAKSDITSGDSLHCALLLDGVDEGLAFELPVKARR